MKAVRRTRTENRMIGAPASNHWNTPDGDCDRQGSGGVLQGNRFAEGDSAA